MASHKPEDPKSDLERVWNWATYEKAPSEHHTKYILM